MTPPNNQPREFWIPYGNHLAIIAYETEEDSRSRAKFCKEVIHVREVLNQHTIQDVINFISNQAGNYCTCESRKPIYACHKHALTDLCRLIENEFITKGEVLEPRPTEVEELANKHGLMLHGCEATTLEHAWFKAGYEADKNGK